MKSTISITERGKIITFTAVLESELETGMYYDEEKTLYPEEIIRSMEQQGTLRRYSGPEPVY